MSLNRLVQEAGLTLTRDIVDTTEGVGCNIWKVLFGAIDTSFDDDSGGEESS